MGISGKKKEKKTETKTFIRKRLVTVQFRMWGGRGGKQSKKRTKRGYFKEQKNHPD